MSWDDYVKSMDQHTGSSRLKTGALFGDKGEKWACGGEAPEEPTAEEAIFMKRVCKGDKQEKDKAQQNGIKICGRKYRFIRQDSDDGSVEAVATAENGKILHCSLMGTKTGLVVCVTEDEAKSSNAKKGAHAIGSYLNSMNI